MYQKSLSDDADVFAKLMGETTDTSKSYNTTSREYGNGFMDLEDIDMSDVVKKGPKVSNSLDLKSLSESIESAFSNPPNIMDSFLNVPAVKQKDFVESKVAPKTPEPTTLLKNAEKVMKDSQKDADSNKKWMEVAKKQKELSESVVKFECMMKDLVENLVDDQTRPVMEALHKAFKESVCAKI